MTMRRSMLSIPRRTSTMVVTVAGSRVDGSIGAGGAPSGAVAAGGMVG